MLSSIQNLQNSKPKLKRAVSDDKSQPVEAGKVLHKHLAPRVFTREVRDLMHEIQQFDKKDKKSKLKKTKTYDRSKPYIPKDIEIFFYGGKDVDKNNKNLAPPPKSREIPNKSPSPPPSTGKSLSEALIFAENGENMLCTKVVRNVRNYFCKQHVLPRFELGIFMY